MEIVYELKLNDIDKEALKSCEIEPGISVGDRIMSALEKAFKGLSTAHEIEVGALEEFW